MERIRGKQSLVISGEELAQLASRFDRVLIDLGTGDGRFVLHIARRRPEWLVIGVDACRENLREGSRRAPHNALFVIANALALPAELHGLADEITINFPWGSLLGGLLEADEGLMTGLRGLGHVGTEVCLRVNAGAMVEAGWNPEDGCAELERVLVEAGYRVAIPCPLDAAGLRAVPTSWAQRLAFGRDPHGVELIARQGTAQVNSYSAA